MSFTPGTPLPWAVTVSGDEVELHDEQASERFGLYVYNLTNGVMLSEQDARYIVRACNSFPELVEALERAGARLTYIYEVTDDTHCGNEARLMANEIAKLLAKAKGGDQ